MPGCPNSLEVDQSLFERNRVLYYFSTLWPVKLNFTKLHSVEILEISSHIYLKKNSLQQLFTKETREIWTHLENISWDQESEFEY